MAFNTIEDSSCSESSDYSESSDLIFEIKQQSKIGSSHLPSKHVPPLLPPSTHVPSSHLPSHPQLPPLKDEIVVLIEEALPYINKKQFKDQKNKSLDQQLGSDLFSSSQDSSFDSSSSHLHHHQYERNFKWPSQMSQIELLVEDALLSNYNEYDNCMNEISTIISKIIEQDRMERRCNARLLVAEGLIDLEQKHFEEIFICFHHSITSISGIHGKNEEVIEIMDVEEEQDSILLELPVTQTDSHILLHSKFKPKYDFWIPITSCRSNYNVNCAMYDFIPYFGDENGISQDLSEFLEKNLRLNEPISAYNQSIHWIVCDLIKIFGLHWNLLYESLKSQKSTTTFKKEKIGDEIERKERIDFFVLLIKYCFPTFVCDYLFDISLDLKKASSTHSQRSNSMDDESHSGKDDSVHFPLLHGLEKAFRFYFCRKCYQLNCSLHSDVVFPASKSIALPLERSNSTSHLEISPVQKMTIEKSLSLGWSLMEISKYTKIELDTIIQYVAATFPTHKSNNCSVTTSSRSSSSNKHHHHKQKSKPVAKHPIDIGSEQRVPHVPCYHPGRPCNEKCPCVASKLYCEKYCFCSDNCSNRFPGCNCSGPCRNTVCICYASLRECDPDLCKKCSGCIGRNIRNLTDLSGYSYKSKKKCQNSALQNGWWKRLFVAKSFVDGLGAFAGQHINESELISEYVGERLTEEEAEHRGRIYDDYGCSYLFKLDRETTIDATVFGAPIRFANHSNTKHNCYAKIVMVNGEYRIGLYATRYIRKGEEILFDYGYTKDQRKFVNKTLPPPKSIVNSKHA